VAQIWNATGLYSFGAELISRAYSSIRGARSKGNRHSRQHHEGKKGRGTRHWRNREAPSLSGSCDSYLPQGAFTSHHRTAKIPRPLGLNEDPAEFSVSCRQMGPITTDISKLPKNEEVFNEETSIFFKATRIYRLPDKKHNTLVYLAVSSKIVNGSPANAVSVVPIIPWTLQ
jgi:CreA protein